MYFPALFSKLSILYTLYISYILYVFPIKESYIAAYMKQENCLLLSRVNCILWNKITNVCYSLKTEVFQGKFRNAFCSLRDLLKLSLWNCLGVCFLQDHGLVLVLANLTMISSMIFKRTDAMALLGNSCSDLLLQIFPLLFYIVPSLVFT